MDMDLFKQAFHFVMKKTARQSGCVEHPVFFIYTKNTAILLQRDETRRVCGSNTRATVLDWFVGDGELSQVVTTHLGLWRTNSILLVTWSNPQTMRCME